MPRVLAWPTSSCRTTTSPVCPYVGPIRIVFENRECYVGDEVLLGAVPMEDMDLVISPPLRRVTANPQHPKFAEGPAKGFYLVAEP